ncbi:HNH endonuclease signature motif containing protein [Rhodococcus sp. IEGM 1374]|uniref:HNH endonuclease signature motif containing protein n=1 Tax=Rhodococcus sp. IEGM 1374 TaxID=3082221 RepID=UPI002955C6E5|nr:HNH endonuclease signature motif containing protein [Rhodococcus sp. IEGM 1374]MDV7992076.1 HNH endonuclease signature motif containing protein [Rhodococcus sp. IEGM 1374]
MPEELSDQYVEWLSGLKVSKRAVAARDYLIQNVTVTTEKLAEMGYDHPPRIIADLKEAGVTLDKTTVKSSTGKNIAQYFLVEKITDGRAKRIAIPKKFREDLNAAYDHRCAICTGQFEGRELQADHRVPFFVGGDKPILDQADYMPLCASDNRSKSWSCEHCENFEIKDVDTCVSCFWAHPEQYSHVAMRDERRINLTFQGDDVEVVDHLKSKAESAGLSVEQLAKQRLREA